MEKKSIFESKEQYNQFIQQWKSVTNSEQRLNLTLEHFILYRLLKGLDWKKCIASTSSDDTMSRAEHAAVTCKAEYLSLWPFGETITPEMVNQARSLFEVK